MSLLLPVSLPAWPDTPGIALAHDLGTYILTEGCKQAVSPDMLVKRLSPCRPWIEHIAWGRNEQSQSTGS